MRGERNHRNAAGYRGRLEPPSRFPTIKNRYAQIHDDECRHIPRGTNESLFTVGRHNHLMTLTAQARRKHINVVIIVLDIENSSHGGALVFSLPLLAVPACATLVAHGKAASL